MIVNDGLPGAGKALRDAEFKAAQVFQVSGTVSCWPSEFSYWRIFGRIAIGSAGPGVP
ncbi:hypothetical protein [Nocardia abscessus]|uniref:hypothetical protein n=1 Tax=Nocardia abscessus TaxID=120957 RepID=UPI002453EF38|nr:hypothetical protein [Nocardia abscessus]